jgi:hypothetical protein
MDRGKPGGFFILKGGEIMERPVELLDLNDNGSIGPEDLRGIAIRPLLALVEALERFEGVGDDSHSLEVFMIERILELDEHLAVLEEKSRQFHQSKIKGQPPLEN